MDIKVLGVAYLIVLDNVVGLQETILGVLVVHLIDRLRVHCVAKVSNREVATCGGEKISQLRLKTRRREMKTKI